MTESCYQCKNFIPINEEGECYIYFNPNHGISKCSDWEPKEIEGFNEE